mmetsp:Transcript_103427/g.179490  ORF Transcript_103427/g.179490 Transcript_103427/m.179490 type:complete len:484 (-) Transcript_103427:60-1511(-)
MIRIDDIRSGGVAGQFRANADMIGWKSNDGKTVVCHAVGAVRRAEWLEGKLRVLCEVEASEEGAQASEEMLPLDGFQPEHFDKLWRHFESHCGVYIRKHRREAEVSEENFDNAMRDIENAADQVDEAASGSVQKQKREIDLMKKIEGARDGLEEAVRGDKQALVRVFAANDCERIGRLRLVIDTVKLEVYNNDKRWLHLRNIAKTVESVLRECGTFSLWRPAEADNESMLRRQMLWELQRRQGGDANFLGEEPEESTPVDDPLASEATSVDPLQRQKEMLSALPFLPGPLQPTNPSAMEDDSALNLMPAPLPAPTPVDGDGSDDADDTPQVDDIVAPVADDPALKKYEDEEVTDPSFTPAAPPGHENDMHLDAGNRRAHYTRRDSLLEGWVWKQSRILKRWRRRWLVLTNSSLESLKSRSGRKPTEQIDAGTVMRVYSADSEVQQARCYCVVSSRRRFFMVCDDEAQKAEWIRMISQTLGARR